MAYPTDLKYTAEHEWIKVEGDRGRVGITDFAQDQLGDVVYVELPKVGTKVTQFAVFGVIDSVKASSDLYSPVTGEVVAVNEALTDSPELVNKEPYGSGWMIEVRLAEPAELGKLMDASAYESHVTSPHGPSGH
ncbi:MAG TPA: glycine cleavage system protein GcvH [Chloroflexota bacterium]|nr:glycine cleavage system protein GcvH [Chloroflexota bacterium]